MLKKVLKFIGILTLVVIGIALLLVAFIWDSMKWSRYSKEKEAIRYQKEVCDTIKTVNEKFEIVLSDFSKKELKQVHFYLQRDKLLIKDSLVVVNVEPDRDYQYVRQPFDKTNVNDRIIVKVGERYFVLSGIKYIAYYNYGMFGPVGSCDCKSRGFETINGEPAGSRYLIKKFGLLNYQLPPR